MSAALAEVASLPKLDTITASLVARQSRSDDGSMSVPDQFAMMRDYCERQGWAVGGEYTEKDVSGRRPLAKRPGLKQAVEEIEENRSQVILTAYFDRFVRSVATRAEVLVRVEAKGGTVMTMDMGATSDATPVSKFTGVVLAAAAELIAEQAGEKTAVTKQRNIDRGIPPFPKITPAYERIPDGDDAGRLRLHPVNAPILREAIRQRLDEGASYTKLARSLTEQGIKITPGGVEQLFASKLLVGEIHFGNFQPNLHAIAEPLIDHATYRRLQSSKAPRGRYAKSERLLARLGILTCETCGSRMVVSQTKGGAGRSQLYHYYRCGNRLCTAQASIACDLAEEIVRDEAIRLASEYAGRASNEEKVEQARLAAEADEERLSSAIRSLAGLAGEAATRETLDELQAQRDRSVEHYRHLLTRLGPVAVVTAADWQDLSFEGRRRIIRAVVRRAVVAPGRGSGRVLVEGRTVE